MRRFVILRHELPAGSSRASHWDLMLEDGPALRTWALAELPRDGRQVDAEPLPDHRKVYLDYEGPVSGNRGTVRRWDWGTYEALPASGRGVRLRLVGNRLQGEMRLDPASGGTDAEAYRWTCGFRSDEGDEEAC